MKKLWIPLLVIIALALVGCGGPFHDTIEGTVVVMESKENSDETYIKLLGGNEFVLVGNNPLKVNKTYRLNLETAPGPWIIHYKLLEYSELEVK